MWWFYIIGFNIEILPTPYSFNIIIWFLHRLCTLYTDCITLTYRFRICQHNLSLWHTIITDCQDAILRSINILSIFLILRIPSMLPPNESNRFQCTTFTLPSLATGAILKTSNPAYGTMIYGTFPIVLDLMFALKGCSLEKNHITYY